MSRPAPAGGRESERVNDRGHEVASGKREAYGWAFRGNSKGCCVILHNIAIEMKAETLGTAPSGGGVLWSI